MQSHAAYSNVWARRALLFALAAWPTWVVPLPPFEDLPNHLATAYVQLHLDRYPDLVSNGFLKTNSTLFLFLHLMGPLVSLRLAAKLFITLVALAGAIGYSETARVLGKNERAATYVLWAMVHNWFIAMGMLDYALSVPLALLTLTLLHAHRTEPSLARGLGAGAVALLVWYTHVFAVLVLLLLVALEVAAAAMQDRSRLKADAFRLGIPLCPVIALTCWSVLLQIGSESSVQGVTAYEGGAALLYEAWSEWLWSLTKWTLPSIACALVLVWYGVRGRAQRPAFFAPLAMGVLLGAYVLVPYHARHWFHVNTRVLPFLWMGCVLRIPAELPRWLSRVLAAAALLFSLGLGIEYVELSNDASAVIGGEVAVPEGSKLLPMVFDRKGPHGDNTLALLHVWGLYVTDLGTSAPLLFAHSKSFPVSYAVEPFERFHGMNLERFPFAMRSKASFCDDVRAMGVLCEALYHDVWSEFWRDATPRFERVLMVGASPDVRAELPASFRVLFDVGETLVIATK